MSLSSYGIYSYILTADSLSLDSERISTDCEVCLTDSDGLQLLEDGFSVLESFPGGILLLKTNPSIKK
jgi:hypothetical protein